MKELMDAVLIDNCFTDIYRDEFVQKYAAERLPG